MEVKELSRSSYEDRLGYDQMFLDVSVPLPVSSEMLAKDAVQLGETGNYELKYSNFSVVMSKSRNLAIVTAVNIDGNDLQDLPRKNDVWYFDPRIEKKYQYGPDLYSNNDLDRGHLVRRLDPVWGPMATTANEDTFHFTNCSPQHKNLNQRTWLDLEDYILKNTDVHDLKVNVFTGPVFRPDDMLYKEKFQIPAEFWKVVVMRKEDDNKVSTTGYLQTQKNLITDLEFAFGEYKTYQVPLSKIGSLTGLDFSNLSSFDPLLKLEGVGKRSRVIKGANDLIL
jgi:endonuclease G